MAADDSQNAIADAAKQAEALGISSEKAVAFVTQLSHTLLDTSRAGKEAAASMGMFERISNATGLSLDNLGRGGQGAGQFFNQLKQKMEENAKAVSIFNAAIMGAPALLTQAGESGAKGFSSISGQITNLVGDFKSITGPVEALAKTLGFPDAEINLAKIGGPLLDQFKAKLTNLGQNIDANLNFQRAIFNMSAQSGQLDTILGRTSENLNNLGNMSKDYEQHLNAVRVATGISGEAAGKYFQSLSTLPPAFDATSTGGQRMSEQMDQLQKNITLASGSGQDFNEVVSQSKTLLETLKVPAAKVNEITYEGAQLSQSYGVAIGDTTKFLTDMAGTFQMLGDNTEGMTAIFNEFFSGLREGGLGIGPAIQTISEMGKSLSNLTIAQKAFLSSRTGGPGGLLGGIQIEQQLASGDVKGVMDKLQKSFMQQTGGKVITRDEVKDQNTAAQYERQVKLLQSGAFGGIAKSDEQAAAILKAFSHPNLNKKDAEAALQETMDQGTNYQKLSNSALNHISATLDSLVLSGGAAGAEIFQRGATEMGGPEDVVAGLRAGREDATKAAKGLGGQGGDMSQAYSRQAIASFGKDVGEVVSAAKGIMQQAHGKAGGAMADKGDADYKAIEKQKALVQGQYQGGSLSQDMFKKIMHQLNVSEGNQFNRGGIVGTAAHQVAGAHPATGAGAHPGAHPGGPAVAARTTSPSKPDNINLTVNVNVDGKKISQSNQNVALHWQPIEQ
jgi:hypothetical protein